VVKTVAMTLMTMMILMTMIMTLKWNTHPEANNG
jgi:hypothetical protein